MGVKHVWPVVPKAAAERAVAVAIGIDVHFHVAIALDQHNGGRDVGDLEDFE